MFIPCVAFCQVLSIGTRVKYSELGLEVKDGVVLKHFPDKHQTLVVDLKSRKRHTVSKHTFIFQTFLYDFPFIDEFTQKYVLNF